MNGELATDPMRHMCSNCEARTARVTTLWANGYGEKKRFFCDVCDLWEDRTLIYGESFKCLTVREGKAQHEAGEKE